MKSIGVLIVMLVAVLAAGSTYAANDVIWTQAQHHLGAGGLWQLGDSASGADGVVFAQSFCPSHTGTVNQIALGGGFEIFPDTTTPNNLIVEIWETDTPGTLSGTPTLVAQWVTPVASLIDETDADGFPILTVDTSAGPVVLTKGHNYFLAAYSDGDYSAPFSWSTDMSHGASDFWISQDGTATWEGGYVWSDGDPWATPAGTAPPFEFEIRGDIDCDATMIYDQAQHHAFTNSQVFYNASYDTATSSINVQQFWPDEPGIVDHVILGGQFGLNGTSTPNNLIIDIWTPGATGGPPSTLVKRWTIPTASLTSGVDAEGKPVAIADVSSSPLTITRQSYMLSAYSDGPSTAPFWWTVDMTTSETYTYWNSANNKTTWSGPFYLGSGTGAAVAAFEFALRGRTGTVMTLTTPPTGVWGRYDANNSALPFLNPGWNWISMPAPPAFNNNPASFTGFSLPILFNNLYRWQNYTIELYTSDFTTVEGYRGYTLRLDNRIPAVSYQALYPSCPDAEITLIGGWNWIGVPITMSQTAMKVRKDLTGEVRTVAQDAAMGAGAWLNYNWVFYDSADRTVRLVNYMPGADDTLLRPWFGYQVFVGTLPPGETYTLIVPTK